MSIRPSIRDLESEYASGNTGPLEDVIRAFKGIQELPPDNPNAFSLIAGYHGEPFRGAGWGNSSWWGGYCNHGNVLFPTWHRAYLYRLEKALQSIEGCENVMLPYWDETDDISFKTGLPPIFTSRYFPLDGVQIKNPLYSYIFQAGVYDNLALDKDDADYSKPPGYETVRYPYSGLVGVPDRDATLVHNKRYEDMGDDAVNEILNKNISAWLGPDVTLDTGSVRVTDIRALYDQCLKAPNYTVFSNQTSATQYNEDNFNLMPNNPTPPPTGAVVVPLESPHNRMHLAIGGFEMPTDMAHTADVEPGANGDMGENDTAGFDPIFYFHHCFVDRVFWHWQLEHNATETFDIIPEYPGTNSVDAQGPTPGVPANVWLTMDTPLAPFVRESDGALMTSKDVINPASQLGYTYLFASPLIRGPSLPKPPTLRVTGANRAAIPGSFLISTWKSDPSDPAGEKMVLASVHAELSRWHVSGCANCQTHLNVKAFVPLHGMTHEEAQKTNFEVRVLARDMKGKGKKWLPLPKPDLEVRLEG